jgi:AraC family transcriptional activator of pobA
MTTKIPYISWRSRLEDLVPPENRINDDLLLFDEGTKWKAVTRPFKTDITIVVFYESGSSEFMIQAERYHVEAPSMIVILQDSVFQFLSSSTDLKTRVIAMSERFFNGLFSEMSPALKNDMEIRNNPLTVISSDELDVFTSYFEMLNAITKNVGNRFRLEAARHLTLVLFYAFTYSRHKESETKRNRYSELFIEFRNLVKENYRKEHNVAFYANKLFVTPKHLTDICRSQIGKNALDYIEEYVIIDAKELLENTDMSVGQIADELNFSTQSSFGRYFKRLTGQTPWNYRHNHL